MPKIVIKYLMIAFLLVVYINRGLFVSSAYEIDNQDKVEINSVIEWIIQTITGKENGIDEDGDIQNSCNFVKIVQHDFSQQFTKNFDLTNLFSKKLDKLIVLRKTNISDIKFHSQIDHPPEVV